MSLLLKLLLHRVGLAGAYLFPNAGTDGAPAVDEPPPDDDPAADPPADPAAADDDPLDDDLTDDPAAPPPPVESRAARAIRELRERSQRLETELAEERAHRQRASAGPTPAEQAARDEEARLRDPNLDPTERWQIEANRTLRETRNQTAAALAQAADDRDAAAFERRAAANPLYDKYRDRVEAQVLAERRQGRLVSREMVLKYLVGEDLVNGNLKSKTTSTKTVARGKPPAARSDTPRTGSMTEHQKRAARLQDQPI